jgi:hypothetical protein
MKENDSIDWWKICGLGAIDGLFVGLAFEVLRIVYENRRIEVILQQASLNNEPVGYLLKPSFELLIPATCMIAFAGIAQLVYRDIRRRPQWIPLVWLVTGGVAVSAGYVMTVSFGDRFALLSLVLFAGASYLIYRLWRAHLNSNPLLWQVIGISALLFLAAMAQIISLFIVQRPELRQPQAWLLSLAFVLVINLVYGIAVKHIFSKYLRGTIHT